MKSSYHVAVGTLTALMLHGSVSQAQENYPDRPVTMIVPAAAGGITDVPARIVAEAMRDDLGQPVLIDNRGGGGGIIGVQAVNQSEPDGYTLGYVNAATHGLLPALMKSIPYDALEDFSPVVLTVRAPMAIAVRADSPFETLDDLIEHAATSERPINYGTPGIGNTSHLIGLTLARNSGADMEAIHYTGEAPMIQDLLVGDLDFVSSNIVKSYVEAGDVRVLATTGEERWFVFPDIPTLQELGINAEYYAWSGIVAPIGTPEGIITRVNEAANVALDDPDVQRRLNESGLEVVGGEPQTMSDVMESYIAHTRSIGEENNISID